MDPQGFGSIAMYWASLAELQPQVEPLKAKVKAIEAQYLAMLPKK